MKIILLERISGLGQVGDEVAVKNGYARNFLLPRGKALRATDSARIEFNNRKQLIEAHNLEKQSEAESVAKRLEGKVLTAIRQAGESGQLYGSVSTRDIASLLAEDGFTVERGQVTLLSPIKVIGLHTVSLSLYGDVLASITVNVARSADEAERQLAGEDLTVTHDEGFTFEPDLDDDLSGETDSVADSEQTSEEENTSS